MSALISCPHCGIRPLNEFRYGCEAPIARPAPSSAYDDDALADVLFNADNPRGPAREWWHHIIGCRMWFVLKRDTMRDTVLEEQG